MVEDLRWRPIETAPKNDDVQVLLVVDGRTRVGYWQHGANPTEQEAGEDPWTPKELAGGWHVLEPNNLDFDPPAEPTHWMPLPDPALEK